MSENITQFIESIQILPGFRTDHSIVVASLSLCEYKRGQGYWKLNVSLLKDKNYVEAINKLLDIELSQNLQLSFKNRMELLKVAVCRSSIQFVSRKKKSEKLKIKILEKRITKLEQELETPNPLFQDTEEQLRLVKHDLKDLMSTLTKEAIIRSGMSWVYQGEKPSKYFLNLEKQKAQSRTLHRLKTETGEIIEGAAVLEEIK